MARPRFSDDLPVFLLLLWTVKFLLKSNALSLSDDIAMQAHTLVWFRRNLRIRDNAALSAAVKRGIACGRRVGGAEVV